MPHIHVITRSNNIPYCVVPVLISKTLNMHIGDYVSISAENGAMVVRKLTHPPTQKELEASSIDPQLYAEITPRKNKNRNQSNLNQNKDNKSNSNLNQNILVTEDEIQNKIISIIQDNQIIELSDLLNELKVEDKNLIVKVLRELIDNGSINAKDEGDNIWFTLSP